MKRNRPISEWAGKEPHTLVSAIERLPADPARGFRFVGFSGGEVRLSWTQLRDEAARRAAHLSAAGLEPGDRLALVIAHGADFVSSFLAAVIAGVVPVPIVPPTTGRAIQQFGATAARIASAAGAKAILTTERMAALLGPLLDAEAWKGRMLAVETAFGGSTPRFEAPAPRPEDLCFLQFTSGSTAAPKGVHVTHANLVANCLGLLGPRGLDTRPDDRGVSWLPLFHDMGLIGFVLAPIVGDVPVSILSTSAFVRDPRIWLRTIHEDRGTITFAPNFGYALAARRVRDGDIATLDLGSLRVAGCGAEPIEAPTLRAFSARFAAAGFRPHAWLPSYGLAETTLVATFHPLETPLRTDRVQSEALRRGEAVPVGSEDPFAGATTELVGCGRPIPDHELAVLGKAGEVLTDRLVGEIAIAGPSVSSGYFNAPEATAAAFQDGWFRTGDLGYLAEGDLFICGRLKEVIIVRGANVHPQDIEWLVRDLPGVRHGNVAAFGVALQGTESVVIAAEADRSDPEGLKRAIRTRVLEATGVEVAHVALIAPGSLPRTSSGKLQRTRARQLFESGRLGEGAVACVEPGAAEPPAPAGSSLSE